jgi:eukaryotic-like serine/threonine-protein kinase
VSISLGTRFGSYEVIEPIGSGGMGEVYRARDTTLGRDVAIKVLPASFSNDAQRIARFEQEAKTLASLNQANIAHIYGLERSDGSTGIVMELVDGTTLSERIAQGPIPVDEALRIATQIADALEAAHERGIVHRDLKPANVKIKPDGTVKVLDFGIAKALDPRFLTGPGPAALTTPAMTEAGFILGTAAYMSPEQARGKFVDPRTDIWAFGCVLYEMLTGKPAFLGEDVTSTLARVLEVAAKLDALPSGVSPTVRRTLELCLEKDARKRIADMRDVKLALAGTFAVETPAASRRTLALGSVAGVFLVGVFVAGSAVWLLKPAPPPEHKFVTRFSTTLARSALNAVPIQALAIAPSGEFFVLEGDEGIYIRRMGDAQAHAIPGASEGADPVVSPDGRDVAYLRLPGQLVKIAIDGGAPIVLAETSGLPFGASWEPDGTIFYALTDGIWRVSENGGSAQHIVQTQPAEQIYGPHLLPGGQWLLFTVAKSSGANRWNQASIVIQSLATGERRVLRSGGFDARYVPTGHITYMSQNVLFASAFDVKELQLADERVALVQNVRASSTGLIGGSGFYAVANNGTLVVIPDAAGPKKARPQRTVAWVDRDGSAKPLPIRPDDYTTVRLSPDGSKVALVVGSFVLQSDPPPDIYVFELDSANLRQLTFSSEADDGPVWSRDSQRIYYRAYANGVGSVNSIPADGGAPQLVARSDYGTNPLPWSISADGKTLLVQDAASLADLNVGAIDLDKGDKVRQLLDLKEQLVEPSLSPDGHWMLYYEAIDMTSSVGEINIRPYPEVTQQRRPVGPGIQPVFSADGTEIFVFDGAGLSVASVQSSPSLRVGNLRKLFRGRYLYGAAGAGLGGRAWDVDAKNDRFLMITEENSDAEGSSEAGKPDSTQVPVDVTLNWFEELRQRVPKH